MTGIKRKQTNTTQNRHHIIKNWQEKKKMTNYTWMQRIRIRNRTYNRIWSSQNQWKRRGGFQWLSVVTVTVVIFLSNSRSFLCYILPFKGHHKDCERRIEANDCTTLWSPYFSLVNKWISKHKVSGREKREGIQVLLVDLGVVIVAAETIHCFLMTRFVTKHGSKCEGKRNLYYTAHKVYCHQWNLLHEVVQSDVDDAVIIITITFTATVCLKELHRSKEQVHKRCILWEQGFSGQWIKLK